jgi:hypothetical protein
MCDGSGWIMLGFKQIVCPVCLGSGAASETDDQADVDDALPGDGSGGSDWS